MACPPDARIGPSQVLAANGGKIPAFLDVKPAVNGIYVHHQHWQSWLYAIHIRGKTGTSFTFDVLHESLGRAGIRLSPDKAKRSRVVRDWVDQLKKDAHVSLTHDAENTWQITVIDRDKELSSRSLRQNQTREAARAQRLANFKRNLEHHDELRELAARNRGNMRADPPALGYSGRIGVSCLLRFPEGAHMRTIFADEFGETQINGGSID